jgi:hypothetical protein
MDDQRNFNKKKKLFYNQKKNNITFSSRLISKNYI